MIDTEFKKNKATKQMSQTSKNIQEIVEAAQNQSITSVYTWVVNYYKDKDATTPGWAIAGVLMLGEAALLEAINVSGHVELQLQ